MAFWIKRAVSRPRASRLFVAVAVPSVLVMASIAAAGAASAATPTLTLSPSSGSWTTAFALQPGSGGQCASGATNYDAYFIPSSQATSDANIFANGSVLGSSDGSDTLLGQLPATHIVPALSASFADSGAAAQFGITAGKWQVGVLCFTQSTSAVTNDFFTTVTFDGPGTSSPSWSTSGSTVNPVGTSTALAASPASPAAHGSQVTLSATVTAASGSAVPAGTVEFKDGSTDLGSAAVGSSGVATTKVTPADGAHSFTAVFTPDSAAAFSASTSAAVAYTVSAASGGGGQSGSESVTVTIPGGGGGQGELTLTVPSSAVDSLTVSSDKAAATGFLAPVNVSDTRPSSTGWTVSGQASDFTSSGGTIPGDALGWVPSVSQAIGPVAPGPAVAPDSPGLGTKAGVLGSATGDSTATLGATLNLAIPSGQAAGTYSSTITITAI